MVARAEWIALSLGATASALRDLGAHWESGVAATGALALWDSQHKRCTRAGRSTWWWWIGAHVKPRGFVQRPVGRMRAFWQRNRRVQDEW
jgi:hypothetical protein